MNLSNTWRISTDISPVWGSILHNLDCAKSYGKWAQPGAWTDLDLMEIDIGDFSYSTFNTSNKELKQHRLMINEAHFAIWSILSAPMIIGMDLRVISDDILDLLMNDIAVGVNQNYLNNGGDVITEFNITDQYRKQYEMEMMANNNQTELFYKPMPNKMGDAAFLFLNRNQNINYSMSLSFNQLPLTDNHKDPLQCTVYDIWRKNTVTDTQFNATMLPMTGKFMLLSDCKSMM